MIHTGDALTVLKKLKANTFDGCLTDPPYGLKFMGAQWDHGVPAAETWAEVLRVLKPGSFLMAFGGTRTHHRLACAIEDAGFEIRDCLMWLYGQGFPKGKGSLKPAWEPIILARKRAPAPVLNIDGCRIKTSAALGRLNHSTSTFNKRNTTPWVDNSHGLGRWPANVLLDETSGAALDEMSGTTRSRPAPAHSNKGCMYNASAVVNGSTHDDSGGASRFFYCAKASRAERDAGLSGELKTFQSGCGGKFSTDDEGKQRDRFKVTARNDHPCVKPLKLTEYLARLILPAIPNARILIPFSGSGSEMLGAKRAGWKRIDGIEMNPAYVNIGAQRMAA